MNWKYVMPIEQHTALLGPDEPRRVCRILDDGRTESCMETREDVQAWVAAGGVIGEPEAVIGPETEAETEGTAGTALGV